MRLGRGGYLIREGFRSIGTHGFMSFATVAVIMACLLLMGSMSLLSVNIDSLIKDLENENEIVAFVDENYTKEESKALEAQLMQLENISAVEYVTKEEAMESFMTKYDDSLMEGIDASVFRDRYVVHLVDIALMADSQIALNSVPGIVKVNAHLDYAKMFVSVRNTVSVISLILAVLLVFVSLFIMTNTIKLATVSRREEIAIMKMVGATNSFIRLPFVVEGLVLGLLGGAVAFVAEWALYHVITVNVVSSITGELLTIVPFNTLALKVLIVYVGLGVVVGVFGGLNAIRNYLKV